MGAAQSYPSINNEKMLKQYMHAVATKYILTQNFEDLKSLNNEDSCNNLVILTSKIMKEHLDDKSILFLDQFMKGDKIINKMTRDNVIFFNKNNLNNLDIKNSIKKRRICIGISKFYIKINMLFAAIVTTLRPITEIENESNTPEQEESAVYEGGSPLNPEVPPTAEAPPQAALALEAPPREALDAALNAPVLDTAPREAPREAPETIQVPIEKKDTIASNVPMVARIPNDTLCGKRLNAVINKNDYNLKNSSFTINPDFCNLFSNTSNLHDEPGIPELEKLYTIDKFNYNTGNFVGMSDEMKKQYQEDVGIFYKAFTNRDINTSRLTNDADITKFSDIKLKDFNEYKECRADGNYRQSYKGNDHVFKEYATRIQTMIKHNEQSNKELLKILQQVFIIDKSISPHIVTIDPSLTEKKLNKLIGETRNILVKLYSTCETDFIRILEIYIEIANEKKSQTLEKKEAELAESGKVVSKSDEEIKRALDGEETQRQLTRLKENTLAAITGSDDDNAEATAQAAALEAVEVSKEAAALEAVEVSKEAAALEAVEVSKEAAALEAVEAFKEAEALEALEALEKPEAEAWVGGGKSRNKKSRNKKSRNKKSENKKSKKSKK